MSPVRFFAGCLVEMLRPDVAAAAKRVLRAVGAEPRPVRGATCCGQPAYNAGYGAEARRVARRTLRALGDGDDPCVVASGSCATMMSHHWPELFEGTAEAAAARRAAARTVELTAYLAQAGGDDGSEAPARAGTGTPAHDTATAGPSAGDRPRDPANTEPGAAMATGAPPHRGAAAAPAGGEGDPAVVVHDPCHALRELGSADTVRRALRGAGRTPLSADGAERCCGFGGSFSVKLPGVSVAMADEKLDNLAATGCAQVTSCDLSCLLHLQGRARRRGLDLRFDHVASLLDPGK